MKIRSSVLGEIRLWCNFAGGCLFVWEEVESISILRRTKILFSVVEEIGLWCNFAGAGCFGTERAESILVLCQLMIRSSVLGDMGLLVEFLLVAVFLGKEGWREGWRRLRVNFSFWVKLSVHVKTN